MAVHLAVLIQNRAMTTQSHAKDFDAGQLNEVADILLDTMIRRAISRSQFIQLIIVEFDHIGLFHGLQQAGNIVMGLAQINVKNFEFGFFQQNCQAFTRNFIAGCQAAKNESIGFCHTFDCRIINRNPIPRTRVDNLIRRAARLVQVYFHQTGRTFVTNLQIISIDVFALNVT